MTTFATSREFAATPDEIFAAFNNPDRLARWWGPDGFTNTFNVFEFKNGGRWSNTMHSPNGGSPLNESIFEVIQPPHKIVIRHLSLPLYRLTVEILHSKNGSTVSWSQEFDDAEVARRIEKVVGPANEQNLDRLCVEVVQY